MSTGPSEPPRPDLQPPGQAIVKPAQKAYKPLDAGITEYGKTPATPTGGRQP